MFKKFIKSKLNYLTLLIFLGLIAKNSYSQSILDAAKEVNKDIKASQETLREIQENDKSVIIGKQSENNEVKEEVQTEEPPKNKPKKRSSIMLSDEESKQVEDALNALSNNETFVKEETTDNTIKTPEIVVEDTKVKEQSQIYLDAILYESKDNWITWVNGNKITPKTNLSDNSIYVESINKESVTIKWKMGLSKFKALTDKKDVDTTIYKMDQETNQIEVDFTLRTNQTYNLTENKITEGKTGNGSIIDDTKKNIDDTINNGIKKLKRIF